METRLGGCRSLIGLLSVDWSMVFWASLRGSVLQRQSDWACKHATTLYPRQGLGRWRCGGGNDGGGKPTSSLPPLTSHSLSTITRFVHHRYYIFPRSRIKAFFLSTSSSFSPSSHGTTPLHTLYERPVKIGSVRIGVEDRRDPRDSSSQRGRKRRVVNTILLLIWSRW